MSDFYMTLPSNASLADFPGNTLTSYVVKLAVPLRLEGKWLVGLTEIQYPTSWYNVTDGSMFIYGPTDSSFYSIDLRGGRYKSVEELIEQIHNLLASYGMEKAIHMYRERAINKVCVLVREPQASIQFSSNLANILGLDVQLYRQGDHIAPRQCDITEGLTSLYVYTNLIEPQIVGDTLAPLLRVVPTDTWGEVRNSSVNFKHVYYIPVVNGNSETVEILIRRDNGKPVSFQSGKVVVTLHFKRAE